MTADSVSEVKPRARRAMDPNGLVSWTTNAFPAALPCGRAYMTKNAAHGVGCMMWGLQYFHRSMKSHGEGRRFSDWRKWFNHIVCKSGEAGEVYINPINDNSGFISCLCTTRAEYIFSARVFRDEMRFGII